MIKISSLYLISWTWLGPIYIHPLYTHFWHLDTDYYNKYSTPVLCWFYGYLEWTKSRLKSWNPGVSLSIHQPILDNEKAGPKVVSLAWSSGEVLPAPREQHPLPFDSPRSDSHVTDSKAPWWALCRTKPLFNLHKCPSGSGNFNTFRRKHLNPSGDIQIGGRINSQNCHALALVAHGPLLNTLAGRNKKSTIAVWFDCFWKILLGKKKPSQQFILDTVRHPRVVYLIGSFASHFCTYRYWWLRTHICGNLASTDSVSVGRNGWRFLAKNRV